MSGILMSLVFLIMDLNHQLLNLFSSYFSVSSESCFACVFLIPIHCTVVHTPSLCNIANFLQRILSFLAFISCQENVLILSVERKKIEAIVHTSCFLSLTQQ